MEIEQFEREYIHIPAHVLCEIENLADILASLDHSWFEDTCGDSNEPGPFGCNWYAVISDKDKGFHAIVRENSDGFHYCATFNDADLCAKTWQLIQIDAMSVALDNGDYEYFGCATEKELLDLLQEVKNEL